MMGTSRAQRLTFAAMAAGFLERMGERIRQRRDALGLSRADLARLMPGKVNENQIYRWEKGLHQPNPDTLEALARVLQCDVAYLMAPEPEKTETPDLSDGNGLEHRIARLSELVSGLDEQLRLLRAETAARDAEVLKRLDEGLPPIQESRP